MADPEKPSKSSAPGGGLRSRRALPLVLVVVATLIGTLAVFAIWAKRQALETDSWTETSAELLADPEIRDAIAGFLVDELYANVDVEGEIRGQLPPQAAALAGPAASAIRQAADEVAGRVLEQPAVQGLWEDANRTAHEAFIKVIEGGGDNVSTEDGVVTLNLTAILAQLTGQLGLPSSLADKLPPEAANLQILEADNLEAAQKGVDLLETLVWVLTGLALLLYGIAIYIAGTRRRETLRAVGFGFIAMGLVVLFVQNAAGNAVVGSLAATTAAEPPVLDTWEISTSMLRDGAGAAVLYGIAIVLAAWLAGPTGVATSVRRFFAPYLRQPRLAYAGLVLLIVVLYWWSPTPATERFVPSLILIVALVLGTEMLRRRTRAEFPNLVTTRSAAGMAQTMAQQTRDSLSSRLRARSAKQESDAAASRIEALERLGGLRESGVLSEREFEAEKAKLIAGDGGGNATEEE